MTESPIAYRVYRFDVDRHTVSTDFIDALTDQDAIALMENVGFGSKCEIWDGRRLVAQLAKQRREA